MSSASTKGTPKFSSVSMKTSRPPASTAGMMTGTVTVRNTRQREAPRFCPASSIEASTARTAAIAGSST